MQYLLAEKRLVTLTRFWDRCCPNWLYVAHIFSFTKFLNYYEKPFCPFSYFWYLMWLWICFCPQCSGPLYRHLLEFREVEILTPFNFAPFVYSSILLILFFLGNGVTCNIIPIFELKTFEQATNIKVTVYTRNMKYAWNMYHRLFPRVND